MWHLEQNENRAWIPITSGTYDACLKTLVDLWYDSPEGADYLDNFRIVTDGEEVSGEKLYNAIASCK